MPEWSTRATLARDTVLPSIDQLLTGPTARQKKQKYFLFFNRKFELRRRLSHARAQQARPFCTLWRCRPHSLCCCRKPTPKTPSRRRKGNFNSRVQTSRRVCPSLHSEERRQFACVPGGREVLAPPLVPVRQSGSAWCLSTALASSFQCPLSKTVFRWFHVTDLRISVCAPRPWRAQGGLWRR